MPYKISSRPHSMFGCLRTMLLGVAVLVAGERSSEGERGGHQALWSKDDPLPEYHELQEPVPTGLDWFGATEREISEGGVLHDAVHNVKKVASLGRELSGHVLDALKEHSSNVDEAQYHMDQQQKVTDELPNKVLDELKLKDDARMKSMNDAMKGVFPEANASSDMEDHYHKTVSLTNMEDSEVEDESEVDEGHHKERNGPGRHDFQHAYGKDDNEESEVTSEDEGSYGEEPMVGGIAQPPTGFGHEGEFNEEGYEGERQGDGDGGDYHGEDDGDYEHDDDGHYDHGSQVVEDGSERENRSSEEEFRGRHRVKTSGAGLESHEARLAHLNGKLEDALDDSDYGEAQKLKLKIKLEEAEEEQNHEEVQRLTREISTLKGAGVAETHDTSAFPADESDDWSDEGHGRKRIGTRMERRNTEAFSDESEGPTAESRYSSENSDDGGGTRLERHNSSAFRREGAPLERHNSSAFPDERGHAPLERHNSSAFHDQGRGAPLERHNSSAFYDHRGGAPLERRDSSAFHDQRAGAPLERHNSSAFHDERSGAPLERHRSEAFSEDGDGAPRDDGSHSFSWGGDNASHEDDGGRGRKRGENYAIDVRPHGHGIRQASAQQGTQQQEAAASYPHRGHVPAATPYDSPGEQDLRAAPMAWPTSIQASPMAWPPHQTPQHYPYPPPPPPPPPYTEGYAVGYAEAAHPQPVSPSASGLDWRYPQSPGSASVQPAHHLDWQRQHAARSLMHDASGYQHQA